MKTINAYYNTIIFKKCTVNCSIQSEVVFNQRLNKLIANEKFFYKCIDIDLIKNK